MPVTMYRIRWDSKDKKFGYQGEPIYISEEMAEAVAQAMAKNNPNLDYRVEPVQIESRR